MLSLSSEQQPKTLHWVGDAHGYLRLLDQTRLPGELCELECRTVEDVWQAIRRLAVRGAPAIGCAAAYGVVLGLQDEFASPPALLERLQAVARHLAASRPTAVNLFWALERLERIAAEAAPQLSVPELRERILEEARAIEAEDRAMCAAIGRHGAALLADGSGLLTHCNAGSLATAGDGTALAVIYAAAAEGKRLHVYADETRPLLQGARLTAWELQQRNIPVTLICDAAAAHVMQQGRVQAVITGADRIAANGDAANKIGTYSLALLARAHGLPFYVAAPSSTFDLALPDGRAIPIEERPPSEITHWQGRATAPAGVAAYNPAFDVTPAELISALITERGVIRPVDAPHIRALLAEPPADARRGGQTS
jgi:methylthioribose-1-phosphate isomerase